MKADLIPPARVLILGGGFGGVYAAYWLERLRCGRAVDVTLVSRQNYFLMTPLLFEAGSGVLEPRHAVNPIRPLLTRTQFIEAEIEKVDLDQKVVTVLPAEDRRFTLHYDQLILALGGVTNTRLIPGSENASTFKTLGDAIALRNRTIGLLEQANAEQDPGRKKELLTFVIAGGGLVAVELMGELSIFLRDALRLYPNLKWEEIRLELIESGPHIVPEFKSSLSDYAARTLQKRGIAVRTGTRVARMEKGRVHLEGGESFAAETIILAAGVAPSPLVAELNLEKDKKGRAAVEATMQSKSRPEVWALGDCAAIPAPDGKTYPPLAQHALREARRVAENLIASLDGKPLKPFTYQSKGTLSALGHYKGAGIVFGIPIRGLLAWWVWRTYYLFQMPQWNRRLRIILDWTIELFFRPDVVKIDMRTEKQGER